MSFNFLHINFNKLSKLILFHLTEILKFLLQVTHLSSYFPGSH